MCEHATPLPGDLDLCHEIIRQQADTIGELQRRIGQLEHQVELLLRRQFGPRRESVDPDQLRLFSDDAPEDVAEETSLLVRHLAHQAVFEHFREADDGVERRPQLV